jgi:hypothetical protein
MGHWQTKRATQLLAATSALVASGPTPNLGAALLVCEPAPRGWDAEEELQQAQWHIAQARRLSPMDLVALEKASLLASLKGDGAGADWAMSRIRKLSPSEPGAWFWAGREALKKGDRAAMCHAWRQTLRGSGRFLPLIVHAVPDHLSSDELLDNVLPKDATIIMSALDELTTRDAAPDEARYLKAALAAQSDTDRQLLADDLLQRARIYVRLKDSQAACSAYAAAVAKHSDAGWRLEYCRYLNQCGMYKQASQELASLLRQDPHNQGAMALRTEVYLKIAEK